MLPTDGDQAGDVVVEVREAAERYTLTWEEWEDRVRSGRIAPTAEVRIPAISGDAFVLARDLESYNDLRDEQTMAWRQSYAEAKAPLATALLVGVQVRIWWLAQAPMVAPVLESSLTKWTAPTLEDAEIWRVLSMGVLHTSWAHLTMNMLWLAYTAYNLERALGWLNLTVLYFASVAGGSLLSMWGAPHTPSLGASGGVFGLIGACVVFGLTRPDLLPERARRYFGVALVPYAVLMLLSGLSSSGTDNWAHFGGMLTGCVLAFIADPEGLERRPLWNRNWRAATGILLCSSLATMAWFGPQITPIADELELRERDTPRSARLKMLAEPQPLRFMAPASWVRGRSLLGRAGWVSPMGNRSWSVAVDRYDSPQTASSLLAGIERRSVSTVDALTFSEPVPTVLGGHAALTASGSFSDRGHTFHVVWTAVIRGSWVLEAVWEVGKPMASRLDALHARLLPTVEWDEPLPVADARAAYEAHPQNPEYLRDYALQLAEIGSPDEALPLLDRALEEHPESWRDLEALLTVLRLWPDHAYNLDTRLAAALASPHGPRAITAVAKVLISAKRKDEARGLLDHAWLAHPGDQYLARARADLGLSNEVQASAELPRGLAWDVAADRAIRASELEPWRDQTPSLATAKAWGDRHRAAMTTLTHRVRAQVLAGDPALARSLVLLAEGHPPDVADESLEAVRLQLSSIDSSAPPWWEDSLPAPLELLDALSSHEDAVLVGAITR